MMKTTSATQLTLLDEREAGKPYSPPILVTDELVDRYRSTIDLLHREWRDERVRDWCTYLTTYLKRAINGFYSEAVITDIVAVLIQCEPLHERVQTSYEGTMLWVCSRRYSDDRDGLQRAVTTALERFPEDARFQRIARQMAEEHSLVKSRRAHR